MKIDKVILASDSNNFYLDFWEPVSRLWKEKFNIDPVLCFFYKDYFEEQIEISEKYGKVLRIKSIPEIPIALQAQWSRYFFPSLEEQSTWLLSDIDMIPMSEFYFIDQLKKINEDDYVHLNPCMNTYGRIPACYHVASGINYKKYLSLPNNWEKSLYDVYKYSNDKKLNIWFADENYSTMQLKDKNINFIERDGGQNGHRVDRDSWKYNEELIKKQFYYDCHSIRPYIKNKQEIDKLIQNVLNSRA